MLGGTLLLAHTDMPGIPCLFKLTFHIPCPGCGMTRSLTALWHGDLLLSFRYHPLGIPLFAVAATTLLISLIQPGRITAESFSTPIARRVFGSIAFATVALWIGRLTLIHYGNEFFLW